MYAQHKKLVSYDEAINQLLLAQQAKGDDSYVETGLVSGSKMGKPALWAILTMLGIPDPNDAYTIRKFHRGDDSHARGKEYMTGIKIDDQVDNERFDTPDYAPLKGTVWLEKEGGYRGGSGSIDIMQLTPEEKKIVHEIKSVTAEKFDRITKGGWEWRRDVNGKAHRVKGKPTGCSYSHILQASYYALGERADGAVIHYLNTNDYRMASYWINPEEDVVLIENGKERRFNPKQDIDTLIDEIYGAFATKELPVFKPVEVWQSMDKYQSYKQWCPLNETQLLAKLKAEYPDAYRKFMDTTFNN